VAHDSATVNMGVIACTAEYDVSIAVPPSERSGNGGSASVAPRKQPDPRLVPRLPRKSSNPRPEAMARSSSGLAGKSKTPGAGFAQPVLMSNINPNCDGSHCRPGYKEVRQYPLGNDGSLYLCLPCFANENMHRYTRAKETGRSEDWPQVHWSTAEVAYDKHGEPFGGVPRGY
jgi:hypothetical protein